jgi:hypothetical protein
MTMINSTRETLAATILMAAIILGSTATMAGAVATLAMRTSTAVAPTVPMELVVVTAKRLHGNS